MITIMCNLNKFKIKSKDRHIFTKLYKIFDISKDTRIYIETKNDTTYVNVYDEEKVDYPRNYIHLVDSLTEFINEYLNYKIKHKRNTDDLTYEELLNIIMVINEAQMQALYHKFISTLYNKVPLITGIKVETDVRFYKETDSLYIKKYIINTINEIIKSRKLVTIPKLRKSITKNGFYYMHRFINEM